MLIIIDAYNYIKSICATQSADHKIIQSYIEQFRHYMQLRSNKIVLVFDAGPFYTQSRELHGGVEVIYAGQSQTADDVIKFWLERNKAQDLLLVTSDWQIRDYASKLGLVSISSQEFHRVFTLVMQQEQVSQVRFNQSIHKMKKTDMKVDESLDQLLEQSTRHLVVQKEENGYDAQVRVSNSVKKSKNDRQIIKKIDKI